MIAYQGHRILLPGDLEFDGLKEFLDAKPQACDVMMAPHHGSQQSNLPELAQWASPAWVIFSDDGRWNRPEIDATYQKVGAKTMHTSDCGAIRMRIDTQGVSASPFLPQ
jgi:competence protein ComEC